MLGKRVVLLVSIGVFLVGLAMLWPTEQKEVSVSLVEVTMPTLDDIAAEGADLFTVNCAACHGNDVGGIDGKGPPLIHKIYEPNHHGDMAFVLAARQGVRRHHWNFGDMPPVNGVSDADIAAIIAYVRTVQKANGIF